MITFNTSDFKIAHSAAGKIETVNSFTMNIGDKVVAKVTACETTNDTYVLRLLTGNTTNIEKKSGDIKNEIVQNGYSLIIFEYTNNQSGILSIGNYFGNYTISEWYIIKA